MDDLLTRLERLEAEATPGPWEEHEDINEGFWLEGAAGGVVSHDTGLHIWPREADCNLMIAARNALPALLRLARAVAAEKAAALAMDKATTDAAYVEAMGRYTRAALDTAAALAALEEPSP